MSKEIVKGSFGREEVALSAIRPLENEKVVCYVQVLESDEKRLVEPLFKANEKPMMLGGKSTARKFADIIISGQTLRVNINNNGNPQFADAMANGKKVWINPKPFLKAAEQGNYVVIAKADYPIDIAFHSKAVIAIVTGMTTRNENCYDVNIQEVKAKDSVQNQAPPAMTTEQIKERIAVIEVKEADDRTQQKEPTTTTESDSKKVVALQDEIERLKAMIAKLQNFSDRDRTDVTLQVDEYLTEIKERSEAYLYEILQKLYPSRVVKWLNYNSDTRSFNESYQHHDFEILDSNRNVVHYIDCKATPHQKRTFYLTTNEWDFFLDCVAKSKSYQIYRVFNLETSPNYIVIDDLRKWIETGKVVPYLPATETIKGGRVCLTLV